MIKPLKDGRFQLFTSDGSRPLGPPTTKEKAEAQERMILQAEALRARKHDD